MLAPQYAALAEKLSALIPRERVIDDPLRTLAYGTDASFYRLVPQLVVRVQTEAEVVFTVRCCTELGLPYTFRAAGTSLSGQAVSDSVLIQISRLWNGIEVAPDELRVRLQPAVLGAQANAALAKYHRKIGPDPASIDSAMIGGIAANNSSGMCCGNIQDTYHTMASMRVVLTDGTLLDTGSEESRRAFAATHAELLAQLEALARRTQEDAELSARIRKKYKIKNTMGYSLHALIDFTDPFDVLGHLMVGSEGTLGFMSEVTYNTVPDPPHHATALLLFPDIRTACSACIAMRETPVTAVELMDRISLRSVENKPGIPEYFRSLDENVAALLVETAAYDHDLLAEQVKEITGALHATPPLMPAVFTTDAKESKQLWAIRKGLFPSLGYTREIGSTIIIEDIAVVPEQLADAVIDLRDALLKHGYSEAVIFGHALQGNVHFVFCPDFNRAEEVQRYDALTQDVAAFITEKYDGSLKAEHGTGRNMAPFLELEWGAAAMELMREIKRIFDPAGLANPGVILNADPQAHIKDLKLTWPSDPIIERCTECGFCERTCPSRHLTLTPRQRIVGWREISHLRRTGEDPARLAALRKSYDYQGDATCAVDSLCATVCPLDIDTGKFIKEVRHRNHSRVANALAWTIARNMRAVTTATRLLLRTAGWAQKIFGPALMERVTGALHRVFGSAFPRWTPWLPAPATRLALGSGAHKTQIQTFDKVVYFPSCVSRLFGVSPAGVYSTSQTVQIIELLRRGGYDVVIPEQVSGACCGMAFSSKGYSQQGDAKLRELGSILAQASEGGRLPVVFDTSPCAYRMREALEQLPGNLEIYDLAEFILQKLAPRLPLRKLPRTIAVHAPCSLVKMGLQEKLVKVAQACAQHVVVPETTPCCGFAGDRGFKHPELTASALVQLKGQVNSTCEAGYSTSRTCEIGLSSQSGISYQSIAYLVEEASRPAKGEMEAAVEELEVVSA